jgi:hypothetical protein
MVTSSLGGECDEHQLSSGNAGHVVRGENRVTRKALKKALFNHDLRAAGVLFGGLKNQVQRARKLDFLRNVLGRCHQHGGVPVVAAGVHHARVHAAVRQVIGFVDGQGVHVGPQAQALAANAALQLGHQPGGGQAPRDAVAPAFQLLGQHLRGAELFETQLGVAVQITTQRHKGSSTRLQGVQHAHWASSWMDLAMPW